MEHRRPGSRCYTRHTRKRTWSCTLNYDQERAWEPNYLRARCKELNLEEEYKWYQVRLMTSYLGVFFLLHFAVSINSLAVLLLMTDYPYLVYPDVFVVIINTVLVPLVLSINFFEDIVRRHRWVLVLTSVLATLMLVGADLGLVTYHFVAQDWPLTASLDIYALCMIYMFLPIPSVKVAVILSLCVSALYVAYFFKVLAVLAVYATRNALNYDTLTVDIFHFFGFSMLGIFFRIMNDTMVRASFLDRHQFIMEEIWLRHALLQESMLLDKTLPPQIAKPYQESIRNKILQQDGGLNYNSSRHFASNMTIQMHSEVTILYADVVNYTYLTTTLSVETLVKVLHDLYGRFDMEAAIYKVQRIKFLGDCYYCVAGLAAPDPDHARNTVSLGLAMISNIQEVRAERELEIDMRIGVHSGSLYAGVIGHVKLQFDIWGNDVDVANHLEATGEAGSVHISGRTLSLLNASEYRILPGTKMAKEDPVLQKHLQSTYLIAGTANSRASHRGTTTTLRESTIDIRRRPVEGAVDTSDSMTKELHEEFSKMPVGGFDFRHSFSSRRDQRKSHQQIGCICTQFKDATLERNYLHQPDFTFKSSILLAWVTGVCLIYIELMDTFRWSSMAANTVTFIVLTSLLFISWYKKLCWWKNRRQRRTVHYNRFSCFIFHLNEKIQRSLFLRIFCYLMTIFCYYSVILLIVANCDRHSFELEYIESKLYHYEVNRDLCFHPWPFTNMTALVLGMSYTFARIPFALKTCVSCIEAIIYLLILFFQYPFVFQHSSTTAPFLSPEVAHCARIICMLLTLYAKERQVEFNSKTNYRLNLNLKNKQKMAKATNQSIMVLLNNILPSHVVALYLDSLSKHELYYENYEMISVMFAKLMNFKMDLPSLRVLNCIISEFDSLLMRYKQYYMVEKIKVVGCTYMAACGLDFTIASKVRKGSSARVSRFIEMERARNTRLDEDDENDTQDAVVFLMTTFALDLMRTLASCNKAYAEAPFDRCLSSTQIGIGISSGEVMAGVVGASQPHYDIWGNPVNMASRMQSTGLPGHIQVTEESAEILMDFGIECYPRGLTFVKGRGEIPTYFVALDEKLHFVTNDLDGTSKRYSLLSSMDSEVYSVKSHANI